MRETRAADRLNQSLHALAWFKCVLVAATVAVMGAASASAITQVTFSAAGPGNNAGEVLSASIMFQLSISGNITNLTLTLKNTATFKPNDPSDILTAVFFRVPDDPALTKVSGWLSAGSVAVEDGADLTVPGVVVGGSWAYASGLNGAPHSANEGLSAVGFGLFGPHNLFPGAALPGDSPVPGGVGGGLTTATDDGSNYNGGLSGRPFIKNIVVLTLEGVPATLRVSDISDVSVQYGTSLFTEPNLEAIPEPSTAMLAASGFFLLVLVRRKRS